MHTHPPPPGYVPISKCREAVATLRPRGGPGRGLINLTAAIVFDLPHVRRSAPGATGDRRRLGVGVWWIGRWPERFDELTAASEAGATWEAILASYRGRRRELSVDDLLALGVSAGVELRGKTQAIVRRAYSIRECLLRGEGCTYGDLFQLVSAAGLGWPLNVDDMLTRIKKGGTPAPGGPPPARAGLPM